MIVERLENFYRDLAEKRAGEPGRWNRASSIGYCQRRLAFIKLGVRGEPLQPRRLSIFKHGDGIDSAIKNDLITALGDLVLTRNLTGSAIIEGVEITGEADFLYQLPDGRIALGEIKSMADLSFERATKGQIDDIYQAQAWVYTQIFDLPVATWIAYRKETSHLCEVTFDMAARDVVVTQRYGGDEIERARHDPMLLAEVRSPFDPVVAERARETIRNVRDCNSLDSLPPGVNAVEPEVVKVQGAEKAERMQAQYGAPIEGNGSWRTFATGRKLIGFPCSYCPFMRECFSGASLELKSGKPKWVI